MKNNLFLSLPLCFWLAGCGGGSSNPVTPTPTPVPTATPTPNAALSASGRSMNELSLTLSQPSASIAAGQNHRYTLTAKNDTMRNRGYLVLKDAQGLSPASLSLTDAAGREVYDFPSFEGSSLVSFELKPGESLTRTVTVPASVLARGTYRATAYFLNGIADGPADALGPLEVRVR